MKVIGSAASQPARRCSASIVGGLGLGYTAVTVIIAFVLNIIAATVIGSIVGVGSMMRSGTFSSADRDVSYDEDSSLGRLEQWSKGIEAAGKKLSATELRTLTSAKSLFAGEIALEGGEGAEVLVFDLP